MPLVGIIDLGSNSVRLVVYEAKHSLKETKGEAEVCGSGKKLFRDVMDEKKIAGLSAYVVNGEFTKDGVNCAIEVLNGHIQAAANIGCDNVHIFATAVIRNCRNSDEVVKRIDKAIGHKIDVLSDEEEAHLGFVGATCDRCIEDATLIDIGGGSSELTAIKKGEDVRNISLPQGSVSSYARHVEMILPKPEESDAIRGDFMKLLSELENLDDFKASKLCGIGGSVRAIDKLYATAFSNNNRLRTLERYQLEALADLFYNQPSTFAHAATKAVPERLHTIVPGMIIARTLMDVLEADHMEICKYGIREGYLLERVMGLEPR